MVVGTVPAMSLSQKAGQNISTMTLCIILAPYTPEALSQESLHLVNALCHIVGNATLPQHHALKTPGQRAAVQLHVAADILYCFQM